MPSGWGRYLKPNPVKAKRIISESSRISARFSGRPITIARSYRSRSFVVSTPPSPAAISLEPWQLKQPTSPIEPIFFPCQVAPWACEQSSITAIPRERVSSRIDSISAGLPQTWQTTIARVRPVIFRSMSAGSRVIVSRSTSAKTVIPPIAGTVVAVVRNVKEGTITSSPGPTPTANRAV